MKISEIINKLDDENIGALLLKIYKDDTLFSSNHTIVTLFEYLLKENKTLKLSLTDAQKTITDLERRIYRLEDVKLQKAGRKRKVFHVNGDELDDEKLLYLIDGDFYTIRELEKDVGAHKNQLRARYNRAKQKQQIRKGRG